MGNKKSKLKTFIIIILLLAINIKSVSAFVSYDYVGWVNAGTPQYTKAGAAHLKKSDNGTSIMSKLRSSYTYNTRMSKIASAKYRQEQFLVKDSNGVNVRDYSNITYTDSPYGLGYTSWYDSPYGIFLDYIYQFTPGATIADTTHGTVNPTKAAIEYAKVQYGNSESAFVATTINQLADAKTGAILQKNEMDFPIYLNSTYTIESNVKSAIESKGIKNLYVLGGSGIFDYTVGLTSGFNIIRVGGHDRNDTLNLMKKMPTQISQPQHYTSDIDGYVMSGVPETLKAKVKNYLKEEMNNKNGSSLIEASKYIMNSTDIGSETSTSSKPKIVIGINNGVYESYWICYWKSSIGEYVYQYVLDKYYAEKVTVSSSLKSIETSDTVYKQNNTTYWSKLNSSVNINTEGTTNVKDNLESIALTLYNSDYSSINNSPKQIMTTIGNTTNDVFDNSFSNNTTAKAILGYGTPRTITGRHTFTPKVNNKSYLLYTSAQNGFWSIPASNGITLKTDGNVPTINGIPSSSWTKDDVQFTISADDVGSGIKSITLEKSSTSKSLTTTESSEGINTYVAKATDNVSNEKTQSFEIKIDKTAPTITGSSSYEWTKDDVTITQSASDSLSGMNRIELYNSSGTKVANGTSSISYEVSTEGVNSYTLNAYDNVGNMSSKTITVKIDKTNPTAEFNPSSKSWTNEDTKVKISVNDSLSGVKSWKYAISNNNGSSYGDWINGSGTSTEITLNQEGTSKIKVEVTDNASNVNTLISGSYQIDKTKPTAEFNPNSKSWTNQNIEVTLSVSDNLSGVKSWKYTISNNNGISYGDWINGSGTNTKITLNQEGTSKIKIEVTDNAANVNTVISGSYQIDKTAPTATSYNVVDREDDTFTIDIIGVTDNGGSGVKSQQIKVWVDTPTGRIEKYYKPVNADNSNWKVVVNRNDFGGVTKTYYYELTLVDNVNNSRTYSAKTGTMIQNNLTANRVDVYDPRENRYVSQTIKGLEYYLVFEVANNGERKVSKEFSINYKIDGESILIQSITDGIAKGETKNYRVKFVAGEENLKGVYYSAIVDCNDDIFETNEDDNFSSSDIPYDKDRTDDLPPIIPTETDPDTGKIKKPVPIINIDLDLEAYSIEAYDMNNMMIDELIVGDNIKIKYEIKNNSNLALKYIDIANKKFSNKLTYKNNVIDTFSLNNLGSKEVYLREITYIIPELEAGVSEEIVSIKSEVDYTNNIKESNENNNIKIKNKKVLSLKLINYRVAKMINPIKEFDYPIIYDKFPIQVKAGYNVYFKIDAIGNPSSVYAKITDSSGYDYGIHQLNKVKNIDNNSSEWEYVFYPNLDTEDNTYIITELIAEKGKSSYNFNKKNNWDGRTLKIGGNALDDIIIYRGY